MKTLHFSILNLGAFFLLLLTGIQAQSDVPATAREICPLLPGEEVPELSLVGIDGEKFVLSQRPVVMIFYRGGW